MKIIIEIIIKVFLYFLIQVFSMTFICISSGILLALLFASIDKPASVPIDVALNNCQKV